MTVNQFINELKHKSFEINIFEGAKIMFLGTVGVYLTSVVRNKIGYRRIDKIEPLTNELNIFIVYKDGESNEI